MSVMEILVMPMLLVVTPLGLSSVLVTMDSLGMGSTALVRLLVA